MGIWFPMFLDKKVVSSSRVEMSMMNAGDM
jgi:hypothetical protein